MFALTPRLMLRPGWPEDAPVLAETIAHEPVVRMTSRVPWPYRIADAQAYLARPHDHLHPDCLIFERSHAALRLIGGIGLYVAQEAHELGYWLTPAVWGRGFATEAARAMIGHARHGLGVSEVQAGHFADNPASGRVLRKLGFEPTGNVVLSPSIARGCADPSVRYRLRLDVLAALPVAA
ncbi:GNAT family N-acetyltransferase [uncultured Sphingomonas sp.]|uniref:GNAT family N-acetyltransferase n=1 Tax=uncultured Sphingomonas sp. TaxID=158754 RepID=UPI0035CA71A9